jgi:hypothetical protein
MMAAMIGASMASSNIMEIKASPFAGTSNINPEFSGLGQRASYGRRTSSGHTRIRKKNLLHVSKAAKRKHRKAEH